jgi:hypothetical protein
MTDCFERDTVLQRRQKDIWFPPNEERKNRFADSIDVIMHHYVSLAKKFKSRGGRMVFICPPVSGKYLESETVLYPKDKYWDRLIQESESPGYYYSDHPDTKYLNPPEWSHLNKRDADIYTRTIIGLLKKEGLI